MRRSVDWLLSPAGRALAGIAVTGLFVALFLRDTDFGTVGNAFADANVALILLGLVAYFAGVWFRAVRWHYLFHPVQPIAPRALFPVVAIGYATNNLLPARTGEVVRAHVFARQFGVSQMAGIGSVAMERLFDGLMLTIFLCVGVAASLAGYGGMTYAGDVLLAAMAFLVLGVTAAFLLSYRIAARPQRAEQTAHWALSRLPFLRGRPDHWVSAFVSGLGALRSRALVGKAIWASAIAWGFEALMYLLVGEAFGLNQPFPVYLLIAAGTNLIITVPSTNGGIGPFEWAAKSVLVLFLAGEAADEVATAYAATLHGLVLVPITIVGLMFLWLYHVPMRRLARGRFLPPPNPEGEPDRGLQTG